MSVSGFHGGLEWTNPLATESSGPATIAQAAQSVTSAASAAGNSVAGALSSRDINEFFNPSESSLSLQERYDLCASVGEEILKEEELMALLERKDMFRCYDGFEPSGRMHIA